MIFKGLNRYYHVSDVVAPTASGLPDFVREPRASVIVPVALVAVVVMVLVRIFT